MDDQGRVRVFRTTTIVSFAGVLALVAAIWCVATQVVLAEPGDTLRVTSESAKNISWAFGAAAAAVGLGSLAAGIAVAYVGAAAVGAISEKPEVTGKALIFVGLAEGIAIYGLIIALMILGKV